MEQWANLKEKTPDKCGKEILLLVKNGYGQERVIIGFTGYMEGGRLEFHTNQKDVDLEHWEVMAWREIPKPARENRE